MGRSEGMGLNLRAIFDRGNVRAGLFKPRRKTMIVRGEEFQKAQEDPDVKRFLEHAAEQEAELEADGLIHF